MRRDINYFALFLEVLPFLSDDFLEVDFSSALTTLHPKAIYMCEGEQYFVEKLDFDERKAHVNKTDVDYFTDAIDYTKIKVLDVFDKKQLKRFPISHGEVHVATQVVGFKKIKLFTQENVGSGNLSLPQNEMHTTAYWLTIPASLIQSLPFSSEEKINGIFGLAYLLHHVSPLFMMCDLHDVGVSVGDNLTGESVPPRDILPRVATFDENPVFIEPDFEPNIFIYDNYPGGIGLSPALFELEKDLLKHGLKTINICPCKEGCPSCVGPARETGRQAKQVAQEILRGLLEE